MVFSSSQKLFSFSRYLNCLEFLVVQKNGLIRKMRLILKFMMTQPGKQTIAIHILLNTRSKDNQTMKFGQLIEYDMREIFLVPRRFSKKSKMSIFLDQYSKGVRKYNLFNFSTKLCIFATFRAKTSAHLQVVR